MLLFNNGTYCPRLPCPDSPFYGDDVTNPNPRVASDSAWGNLSVDQPHEPSGRFEAPLRTRPIRTIGFRGNSGEATCGASPSAVPEVAQPTTAPCAPAGPSGRPQTVGRRTRRDYFLGTLLLASLVGLGLIVWNSFFRYQAHGTIIGRVINIPASQAGIVQAVHVREGDRVRNGQLLVSVRNLESQQQLDQLADQLKIAQATVESELTELKWQSLLGEDREQRALADYYRVWGELLQEQSRLSDLQVQLERKTATAQSYRAAVTEQELEALRFAEQGQRAKVEKLAAAVQELKALVNVPRDDRPLNKLKPLLARIDSLQAEMTRMRERLSLSEVRSPVNGRVVKLYFFAGEFAQQAAPVVEVLEDESLEALLYVPQSYAAQYRGGDEMRVQLVAGGEMLPGVVTRFGERMQPAPPSLQRYYRSNESLLPVHLQLQTTNPEQALVWLGSEVRQPRSWSLRSRSFQDEAGSAAPAAKCGTGTIRSRPEEHTAATRPTGKPPQADSKPRGD